MAKGAGAEVRALARMRRLSSFSYAGWLPHAELTSWGCLGLTRVHDMRSVSKGIVGLLYGIELEQGKVPAPEAPLLYRRPPD
jgi:hypothetical protein